MEHLSLTNLVTGGLLIIYTMSGGPGPLRIRRNADAYRIRHAYPGRFTCQSGCCPGKRGFLHALREAGREGKMNIIPAETANGLTGRTNTIFGAA